MIRTLWNRLNRPEHRKLHLGVGAGSVLALGIAFSPQAPAPVVKPPEDRAAPRLREEIERRGPETLFREISPLADRVGGAVVAFVAAAEDEPVVHPDFALRETPPRRRLGLGLVVPPRGDFLTHVVAVGHQLTVDARLADGRAVRARVVAYEQDTGLVLLRPESGEPALAAALDGTLSNPGEVLAAVTRGVDGGAPLAQPVYVAGTAAQTLALAAFSEGLVAGTPLFALAGEAVAIVGADSRRAWSVARAVDRLGKRAATGRGVPATIGLRLQAVGPELRPFVGEAHAIVADLDPQGPAARGGVRVGDGLFSVDGMVINSVAQAVAVIAGLPAGVARELVVVRDGAHVGVMVEATPTVADAGALLARTTPDAGPPLGRLFTPVSAGGALLPQDAIVLSIDGRPMSERAAATYLESPRARGPRLLYLAHDGTRFFAVAEARR